MNITSLRQVVEYQLCCGCGLCAALCPEALRMVDVPEYGRRPEFLADTVPEGILALCPGAGLVHTAEVRQQPGRIASLVDHWGPVLGVWEGHAADPEIRFQGSSGGALTALALFCLERQGMHGVLHTAVDEQEPYLNRTTMSRNRADLLAAAGSRYSPASPCERLLDVEQAPAPCVFIGKPCDVAAVQNARRQNPALDARLGLTMACFCAGTPSTRGTLEMLHRMGVDRPEQLKALRYRGQGWPGKTVAVYEGNGESMSAAFTYEQSWGGILQKYRQWRCYICPDHTGEFADIASGDPWYQSIEEEEEGQSLLLARTEHGRQIIEQAISAGYLIAKQVDSAMLPASQPNLLKTRARLWGQLLALRLFRAPCPSYQGFPLFTAWWGCLNAREKFLSFAGTIKRIYAKRVKNRHPMSDMRPADAGDRRGRSN